MKNIKLLDNLGNNKYLVEIQPIEKLKNVAHVRLIVAHDYMGIKNHSYLKDKDGSFTDIAYEQYIQIPIRGFSKVILPFWNGHKYTQEIHFGKPNSPTYTYGTEIIAYYEEKELRYAIRLNGEENFEYVTEKFFETFVKPTLI